MIIVLLTGLVLVGSSVALAGRALSMRRMRTDETLGQIDSYGFQGHGRGAETAKGVRNAIDELAAAAGSLFAPAVGG